jgi:hypothetical protein
MEWVDWIDMTGMFQYIDWDERENPALKDKALCPDYIFDKHTEDDLNSKSMYKYQRSYLGYHIMTDRDSLPS